MQQLSYEKNDKIAVDPPIWGDVVTKVVYGVITAILPDFNQADVWCQEGKGSELSLVITKDTPGINFADLVEGMMVKCEIEENPVRVISAEVIPD